MVNGFILALPSAKFRFSSTAASGSALLDFTKIPLFSALHL